MERNLQEAAMRRAFELAHRGPSENVNPQVGCVLVTAAGEIVAEAWHEGAGTPHAETRALAALPPEWRGREAELTAVVTLEPCNHTGHTGPCAVALIESGIGGVVYSASDPGSESAGGAETLAQAGIPVTGGVLAAEGRMLIAPWVARTIHSRSAEQAEQPHSAKLPYVIVKWAQTLDGRAAATDGSSKWITGPQARQDVHQRRAAADAIMVGTGTLLDDNPALTARDAAGELLVPAAEQPVPVVLGRREIPASAQVMQHPALAARGLTAPITFAGNNLVAHLAELKQQGVQRVFVEGGPTLVSALIAQNLADEVLVYLAPALLGGPRLAIGELGIENIAGIKRMKFAEAVQLGSDLLLRATFVNQGDD